MGILRLLSILIILLAADLSAQNFRMENVVINSEILSEDRNINIYFPENYQRNNARYPLVLSFDGGNHEMYLPGVRHFLSRNGMIRDFILVSVHNTDRTRDFTPVPNPARQNSGGGVKFYEFLSEELLPYLKDNFRTIDFTIVLGHSLTGMYSMYLVHNYPEQFQAAVAASPYVQYMDDWLAQNISDTDDQLKVESRTIYFSIGSTETDYFEHLDKLKAIYKNAGENLTWEFRNFENYNHGKTPLLSYYNGLEFIFREWKIPEKPGDDPVADIVSHYKKLSEKYNSEICVKLAYFPKKTRAISLFHIEFSPKL